MVSCNQEMTWFPVNTASYAIILFVYTCVLEQIFSSHSFMQPISGTI